MAQSFVLQGLRFLARPDGGIRRTPLQGAAAWHGASLDPSEWSVRLTGSEIAEIEAAAERSMPVPLAQLTRSDFLLSSLTPRLAQWRQEVSRGRGFLRIRGLPVERWSLEEARRVFWGLGLHLGSPCVQNRAGELMDEVYDTGVDPLAPHVRTYRTSAEIDYHCDIADITGLFCLQRAGRGGVSRLVSSVSVYNELLRLRPELIDRLYAPFPLDTRGEASLEYMLIPAVRYYDGVLRTFYHADYFRSAYRYPTAPELTESDRELLELYSEIAARPEFRLEMVFEPGDIQLVSNHTIVHARTGYTDSGQNTRRLLRLWLADDMPRSLGLRVQENVSLALLIGTLLRLRLQIWLRNWT